MFEHILIPLDFSDKNTAAIEMATGLADRYRAHVTLLHVVETIDDVADDELKGFYQKLEERADRRLDQAKTALEWRKIPTESAVVYGKRADEIVAYAQEHSVDLIIMSSHRLRPSSSAQVWPSISHKVALLTPLPILLVR